MQGRQAGGRQEGAEEAEPYRVLRRNAAWATRPRIGLINQSCVLTFSSPWSTNVFNTKQKDWAISSDHIAKSEKDATADGFLMGN